MFQLNKTMFKFTSASSDLRCASSGRSPHDCSRARKERHRTHYFSVAMNVAQRSVIWPANVCPINNGPLSKGIAKEHFIYDI